MVLFLHTDVCVAQPEGSSASQTSLELTMEYLQQFSDLDGNADDGAMDLQVALIEGEPDSSAASCAHSPGGEAEVVQCSLSIICKTQMSTK